MKYVYNHGGRPGAATKGPAGDCGCRAIAIATGMPYMQVSGLIRQFAKAERTTRGHLGFAAATGRGSKASSGLWVDTMHNIMGHFGWKWTPTMAVGKGCTVHMRADELPPGNIIVRLSGHYAAVIDGVLHDTYDCSRDGSRCVYGYWSKAT